ELAAFVQAVRTGGTAPIPFASLVQTTLTTFRIRDALRTGQPQSVTWHDEFADGPDGEGTA
ncbi:MAG: hypothetical protein KKA73_19830, partial [Chloroflexi bacterium]|nr:hypothetical protein [Chloroflexota bacterium]MBU1749939.1 hypothetical protein [Chloroflexota bacterium]